MRFTRGALSVVVGSVIATAMVLPSRPSSAAPADDGVEVGVVRIEIEPRPAVDTPPGITTVDDALGRARHYDQLADHYRSMGGGVAYRTGLVQRTEQEADRYDALATAMEAPPVVIRVVSPEAERSLARARHFEQQGGGVAWKTGLVRRELAEARRYQPGAVLEPFQSAQPVTEPEDVTLPPEKPVIPSLHTPRVP